MYLLILHIVISLLTCDPGEEVYARFGHTALRVQDTETGMDLVFNYGLFSFDQPHFYARFVKGETYYLLGAQYTDGFYEDYAREGRRIHSQVLNLTEEEAETVWEALRVNYQPQNREYLYNFVFDNCATRPYRLIEEVRPLSRRPLSRPAGTLSPKGARNEETECLGKEGIREDQEVSSGSNGVQEVSSGSNGVQEVSGGSKGVQEVSGGGMTYRERIERCVGENSVEAFGINLLLGPKADVEADSLFLPECLMNYMETTGLVGESDIAPFAVRKTPLYDDIRLWLVVFALLMLALTHHDRKRGKLSWGVDIVIGITNILIIAIVTYLTFFSLHPLVGFGWRLLIIPAIWICSRLYYFLPSR